MTYSSIPTANHFTKETLKMGEHKNDRTLEPQPDPNAELYFITEPATGLRTNMRDCTDEQLHRHLESNTKGRDQMMAGLMPALGQMLTDIVNASNGVAIMEYERDRRKRSIDVVTDLSSIRGLSRQ